LLKIKVGRFGVNVGLLVDSFHHTCRSMGFATA
jgi:hypothetical protein